MNKGTLVSPMQALELLIEGNQRFTKSLRLLDTFATRLGLERLAKEGQNPFCTVLTCSDSRIPVEAIFDRGFGELFVCRIFGTLVDPAVIATLEYGVAQLKVPLMIILGHTGCTAFRLGRESGRSDEIPKNLKTLASAEKVILEKAKRKFSKKSPDWETLFERCQVEAVRERIKDIRKSSVLIDQQIRSNKLLLLGAIYDLQEGNVAFDLPDIKTMNLGA